MSIILEGANTTGKTSFALNWILLNPGYIYISNDAPVSQSSNNYVMSESTKEILLSESQYPLLIDRSFLISEYVYSSVLRRKSCITFETVMDYIDRLNQQEHCISFFTHKNPEDYFRSIDTDLPLIELDAKYKELFKKIPKFDRFDIRYIDSI